MAFPIDLKLVVAISSSAVFDMKDANAVYEERGEEAYRNFQRENLSNPFGKGVALPFIRRLLHLNNLYPVHQNADGMGAGSHGNIPHGRHRKESGLEGLQAAPVSG